MKPGWTIWWWLFDREMSSLVLGICMLGPQLVALLVWCSLIGRRTSEGQTLRCKTYFHLQFRSLLPACSWGCDLSLCFCYAPSSLPKLILVLVFYLSNRKAIDTMIQGYNDIVIAVQPFPPSWNIPCWKATDRTQETSETCKAQKDFMEVTGSTSLPPQCYESNKQLLRKGDHWVEAPPSWAGVSRDVAFLGFCSWWDGSFGAVTTLSCPCFSQ